MSGDTVSRGADAGYREALLERLGDADPIDVLASLFDRLPTALEGLDDEMVARPEAEGKWSILEVVCHLADAELMQAWRIRRILTEERPTLAPMDQDVWATRLRYSAAHLVEALEQLRVMRLANLRLASHLTEDELDRVSFHPERGEESIRTILGVLAGHDSVHLDQIGRIRASQVAG
jgi:uncharacterized damage-inducible protein DinB